MGMHERVQLCQDPQTEFAFLWESLGLSRINHILRVHGHAILQEKRAADIYDEVGQRSLERLFPAFTEESSEPRNRIQKGARHCLGALTAAKTRIQATMQDAVMAGLLPTLGNSPCRYHWISHRHPPRSPRWRRPSNCQAPHSKSGPGSTRDMAANT